MIVHLKLVLDVTEGRRVYANFLSGEFWLKKCFFLVTGSTYSGRAMSRKERVKSEEVWKEWIYWSTSEGFKLSRTGETTDTSSGYKGKFQAERSSKEVLRKWRRYDSVRTLHFLEEPVEIIDREVKSLKHSRIPLVKVRWDSKHGPEFTWEREDYMKSKYPQLFVDHAVEPTS
ncbi:hypothetical protein Tco_0449190 [Tanacetum coccineum]